MDSALSGKYKLSSAQKYPAVNCPEDGGPYSRPQGSAGRAFSPVLPSLISAKRIEFIFPKVL
jgi:hypothetical protein